MSIVSIIFHIFCSCIYVFLQVKFHNFAIAGLILPAIWILNDKTIGFLVKALGIPLFVIIHFYAFQKNLILGEWSSFVGLMLVNYFSVPVPPAKTEKINSRPKVVAQGNKSSLSPNPQKQSAGFTIPAADKIAPQAPAVSPRVSHSAEKSKKDRAVLDKALAEARAEEAQRIANASKLLMNKAHKHK